MGMIMHIENRIVNKNHPIMENDSIIQITKALEEYNSRYNTQFRLGDKYALFPNGDEYGYKEDEWPGNNHAGVYFVLSEDYQLLYVGQSKDLGLRCYQHFPPKKGQNNIVCTISEIWSKQPYFLYVATAPDNAIWERLSLEEFLIQILKPTDNTLGK